MASGEARFRPRIPDLQARLACQLTFGGRGVRAVPLIECRRHHVLEQRRDECHGDHGQVTAGKVGRFGHGIERPVGGVGFGVVVRVARQAVEHVGAHPVVRVPRMTRLHRLAGLTHQAVVGEVVLDFQQFLAQQRDHHPDRDAGETGQGECRNRRHEVLQIAAHEGAGQRIPHRLAELDQASLLHLVGMHIRMNRRAPGERVEAFSAACGGGIVGCRDARVMAVDVLDGKRGVRRERQQPAAQHQVERP